MRRLFFFGGRADNFARTSQRFIEAAGGRRAEIALLIASGNPGWDRNLAWYRDPWLRAGAQRVVPIYPQGDQSGLDDAALAQLARSTGIFMCGGDTRLYHQVYAQGAAREVLRSAYAAGVPYGGLSAGALIAPTICSIWGDRLTRANNTLSLRGSEDGCDAELLIGSGLGLLRDLIVEAHFSEEGGFPRLIAAMEESHVPYGLGFDDPICLEIGNERAVKVAGQGRAYFLERSGTGWSVTVWEPGQEFALPDSVSG